MDDDEMDTSRPSGRGGEVTLPKATMSKIIREMVPADIRIANDTRDLLIECCVEFINLVSSEANEVCSKEEKRTIAPEHVLKALQELGFHEYVEEVSHAFEAHKAEAQEFPRLHSRGFKHKQAALTEEEAIAAQQRMFAEARMRMNADAGAGVGVGGGSGSGAGENARSPGGGVAAATPGGVGAAGAGVTAASAAPAGASGAS
eukprot:jgi/Mesvir1/23242/Mv09243-RA.1